MLASVVFIFLLSGICNLADVYIEGLPFRLSALSYLGHLTLCTLYLVYTRRNIIQPDVKYYITSTVGYLYGWLIIVLMEGVIFPVEHSGNRVLWYMQFIPMLMIPNLLLLAGLHLDTHESQRINGAWWLTFVVTFFFIIGIMTNDIHGAAFIFPSEIEYFYEGHRFNTLFYLAVVWMFAMYCGCAVVLWQKAKKLGKTSYILILLIALGIGVMYVGWLLGGRRFMPWLNDMYSVPQMVEAFILFTTELCMRVGLISSNSNFRELFEASRLSVSLVDGEGDVIYQTAGQVPIDRDQMRQALDGDIYIDENHRLHAQEVSGGHVFWVNDLSSVNGVAKQLRSVQKKLEEENNLIAAENDMIARRVQADEQNKLYTMLAQQMQPQLDKIGEIVQHVDPHDADFGEKLALASVYKVYIKRACNIMLLRQNDSILNGFELENSIRESIEYIHLNGVDCKYTSTISGSYAADDLLRTYNYFQEAIEANIGKMKKLVVDLSAGADRINLRMAIDDSVYDKEIIAPVYGEQSMLTRPTAPSAQAAASPSAQPAAQPSVAEPLTQGGAS